MEAPETAAQTHAVLRARSGFDISQLAAEYRALRASVLRLWTEACQPNELNLEDHKASGELIRSRAVREPRGPAARIRRDAAGAR